MSYTATVILNILITMTAVISMFVLMGLTGIFSMGQASFMCIGAYIAGIMATKMDVPFLVALICAILGGMLCAFLVGIPIMKLRGDYVAMVTLAFGEAIVAVLNTFSNVTGGAMGINRIPRKINPISGNIIVLIVIYLVLNFKKSKFGRQCIAVKNDPISAASMGINVTRIKMTAFIFAGALTALSGAMLAFTTSYIDPNSFGSAKSIDWISIVFVGGINSLSGSVVMACLFQVLTELLRSTSALRTLIQCVIILIIINFVPRGLFGEYDFKDFFIWVRQKLGKGKPTNKAGKEQIKNE